MVCTVVFTISTFVFTTSSSICPVLTNFNKCVTDYVFKQKCKYEEKNNRENFQKLIAPHVHLHSSVKVTNLEPAQVC